MTDELHPSRIQVLTIGEFGRVAVTTGALTVTLLTANRSCPQP